MPAQQTDYVYAVSHLTTIIDSVPTAVVVVDQLGMRIIRERAEAIGADLSITSQLKSI